MSSAQWYSGCNEYVSLPSLGLGYSAFSPFQRSTQQQNPAPPAPPPRSGTLGTNPVHLSSNTPTQSFNQAVEKLTGRLLNQQGNFFGDEDSNYVHYLDSETTFSQIATENGFSPESAREMLLQSGVVIQAKEGSEKLKICMTGSPQELSFDAKILIQKMAEKASLGCMLVQTFHLDGVQKLPPDQIQSEWFDTITRLTGRRVTEYEGITGIDGKSGEDHERNSSIHLFPSWEGLDLALSEYGISREQANELLGRYGICFQQVNGRFNGAIRVVINKKTKPVTDSNAACLLTYLSKKAVDQNHLDVRVRISKSTDASQKASILAAYGKLTGRTYHDQSCSFKTPSDANIPRFTSKEEVKGILERCGCGALYNNKEGFRLKTDSNGRGCTVLPPLVYVTGNVQKAILMLAERAQPCHDLGVPPPRTRAHLSSVTQPLEARPTSRLHLSPLNAQASQSYRMHRYLGEGEVPDIKITEGQALQKTSFSQKQQMDFWIDEMNRWLGSNLDMQTYATHVLQKNFHKVRVKELFHYDDKFHRVTKIKKLHHRKADHFVGYQQTYGFLKKIAEKLQLDVGVEPSIGTSSRLTTLIHS